MKGIIVLDSKLNDYVAKEFLNFEPHFFEVVVINENGVPQSLEGFEIF